MFDSCNLSYNFWVQYFDELMEISHQNSMDQESNMKALNDRFVDGERLETFFNNTCTMKKKYNIYKDLANMERFELKTQYPGLVAGIGYNHATKLVKGEIALGMEFDYTLGLPYIPGSSIKGVLNSAFEYEDYIKECLEFCGVNDIEKINISLLRNLIFEGKVNEDDECGIKMTKRDIFYDSFPYRIPAKDSETKQGTSNDQGVALLALDNITPHHKKKIIKLEGSGKEIDVTDYQEPEPLTFVKVGPNVTFQFCFKLHDMEDVLKEVSGIDDVSFYNQITAAKKKELFKTILMDFGVGAKTNVGYGVLNE